MKHVLIPTKLSSIAKELLEARGFSVTQDSETPLADVIAAHPETDALIVRSEKITPDVIDALPKLKVVVRAGAGYNTIDIKYARKKGVDVMNTPGANANAVAEEVVALMLARARHIVPADTSTRAGLWEKKNFMGGEITGKTIGVVGLGNIGQRVVKLLQGFDVTVLGYDPVLSAQRAKELAVDIVSLEELFSRSDYVTLHIPENEDTRGMINRDYFGLMKDGACLINCARAGVIDENDLRAVKAGKNLGFCNDVYPKDEAGAKSVADIADIMLPHLGASTVEANTNAARRAAEQLMAYAEQGVSRYVVNKGVPDDLDEDYQMLAYFITVIAHRCLGANRAVRKIETSFYGDLNHYAQWLLPPIVAGLSRDFDAFCDPEEAEQYLEDKGVEYINRQPDPRKAFDNSITIDLLEGDSEVKQVSIRGTIAEGHIMISRIDNFEGLYFQPFGHSLIAKYQDRPGVLAGITSVLAENGINIDDIRSPHDEKGVNSLAVLKTNQAVGESVVRHIKDRTGIELVFAISLP
ncbi:MAG: NAD(P)-dependent oxidoreductase [Lentisphaeria bacterium]|nr:NAD(P)-dependent oxidoreductase [Lentisphaeria bacterium]